MSFDQSSNSADGHLRLAQLNAGRKRPRILLARSPPDLTKMASEFARSLNCILQKWRQAGRLSYDLCDLLHHFRGGTDGFVDVGSGVSGGDEAGFELGGGEVDAF